MVQKRAQLSDGCKSVFRKMDPAPTPATYPPTGNRTSRSTSPRTSAADIFRQRVQTPRPRRTRRLIVLQGSTLNDVCREWPDRAACADVVTRAYRLAVVFLEVA